MTKDEWYFPALQKDAIDNNTVKMALDDIDGIFSLNTDRDGIPGYERLKVSLKEEGLRLPLSCIKLPEDWETNTECNPGLGNDRDLRKRHAGVVIIVLKSKIEKGFNRTNQKELQFTNDGCCYLLYTGHQRYRLMKEMGVTHTDVIITEWKDIGDILDLEKLLFDTGGGKEYCGERAR